jgi:hypothetical protein
VARNAEHQVLPSQPTITYSSGTPANATVNSVTGIVTAVANGTSVITAASAGLTSITQTATVSQVVASISGVASTLSTDDSSSGTFSPVGKDANNNTVSSATFAYASSNPSIISVNASTGAWAGQSAGSATISITSGSATFVVSVTVIVSTFSISASTSPIYIGTAFTLSATYNGSGVTADGYTTSDPTKITVDPPTLTSISPSTITQGTNATTTLTGSVNGYAFQQATSASRALYKATGLNSRPALSFNGTSQFMTTSANIAALFPNTGFTVYVFMKQSNVTTVQRIIGQYDGTAHTGFRMGTDNNPQYRETTWNGTTSADVPGGTPNTTGPHMFVTRYTTAGGGAEAIFIDSDVAANSTSGWAYATCTTQSAFLGADANGGASNFFAGLIGEVVVTGPAVTGDLTAMHGYGQTTWGTP